MWRGGAIKQKTNTPQQWASRVFFLNKYWFLYWCIAGPSRNSNICWINWEEILKIQFEDLCFIIVWSDMNCCKTFILHTDTLGIPSSQKWAIRILLQPGVVAPAFNPSTWKAGARRSLWVRGHPRLHRVLGSLSLSIYPVNPSILPLCVMFLSVNLLWEFFVLFWFWIFETLSFLAGPESLMLSRLSLPSTGITGKGHHAYLCPLLFEGIQEIDHSNHSATLLKLRNPGRGLCSYSVLQKLNERHPCHIKVGKVKTVSWGQITM